MVVRLIVQAVIAVAVVRIVQAVPEAVVDHAAVDVPVVQEHAVAVVPVVVDPAAAGVIADVLEHAKDLKAVRVPDLAAVHVKVRQKVNRLAAEVEADMVAINAGKCVTILVRVDAILAAKEPAEMDAKQPHVKEPVLEVVRVDAIPVVIPDVKIPVRISVPVDADEHVVSCALERVAQISAFQPAKILARMAVLHVLVVVIVIAIMHAKTNRLIQQSYLSVENMVSCILKTTENLLQLSFLI